MGRLQIQMSLSHNAKKAMRFAKDKCISPTVAFSLLITPSSPSVSYLAVLTTMQLKPKNG